ncbi:MAG: shikimate dehydrogenase [Chitinophagaceae bacterium]
MRLYGLIGSPLTHSFSGKYFSEKFAREGITGCRYELFPLDSIDELPGLLASNPELCGLNVTIPYKQQVLRFVHYPDAVVRQVGAANCIRIINGQLYAYNTDVTGFETSLMDKWNGRHQRALILGTGGASKAVEYVLRKLALEICFVSRKRSENTLSYEEITPAILKEFTLVVNTTPLGTYPAVETAPDLPYNAITRDHYFFDLVYNPAKTRFLALAEEQGATIRNGADMLAIQAEESWRIWNNEQGGI